MVMDKPRKTSQKTLILSTPWSHGWPPGYEKVSFYCLSHQGCGTSCGSPSTRTTDCKVFPGFGCLTIGGATGGGLQSIMSVVNTSVLFISLPLQLYSISY